MAKSITVKGVQYTFPDDATQDEMFEYIDYKLTQKGTTDITGMPETPDVPKQEEVKVEEDEFGLPSISDIKKKAGDVASSLNESFKSFGGWDTAPKMGESDLAKFKEDEAVYGSPSMIKMKDDQISAEDKATVAQAAMEREAAPFMEDVAEARAEYPEIYKGKSDLEVAYDLSVRDRTADAAELATDIGLTAATAGMGAGGRLAKRVATEAAKGAAVGTASGAVGNVMGDRDVLDDLEIDALLGSIGGGISGAMSPSKLASKGDIEIQRIYDKLGTEEKALKEAMDSSAKVKDVKQLLEDVQKGDYNKAYRREAARELIGEYNKDLSDALLYARDKSYATRAVTDNYVPKEGMSYQEAMADIAKKSDELYENSLKYLKDESGQLKNTLDIIERNAASKASKGISEVDTSYTSVSEQLKRVRDSDSNKVSKMAKRAMIDTADLSDAGRFNKLSKVVEDWTGGGVTSIAKDSIRKTLTDEIQGNVSNKLYSLIDELTPQAAQTKSKKKATSAIKTIDEILPVAEKLRKGEKVSNSDISQLSKALNRSEADKSLITDLATVKQLNSRKGADKVLNSTKAIVSTIVGVGTGGASTAAQAAYTGARAIAQKGQKKKILTAKDLFDEVKGGKKTDAEVRELLGKIDDLEEGSLKDLLIKMIKMTDTTVTDYSPRIVIDERSVKEAKK
ncbi:MAG: hypothetical protein ACRCSY_04000 [Cetobacterium sp.]